MKKQSNTVRNRLPASKKKWRILIQNPKSGEGPLFLATIGSTPVWWRDPAKAKVFVVKAEAEEMKKSLAYKKQEGYTVKIEPINENNAAF